MERFSVFGHAWIDFVGPGENPTFQVPDFSEAGLAEEFRGFRRTLAAAAMSDDFAGAVEFVNPPREFTERNQMTSQVAYLIFVRFANVKDIDVIPMIQPRFQFSRGNLWDGGGCRGGLLPRIPQNSA